MLSTDPQSLELVVLSDFAEDSTPLQHTERLAKIKAGVEQGQSLVLVNAKPLQSSLYSLLNRHYSMAESVDTGKIEAYVQMGVRNINIWVYFSFAFRVFLTAPFSSFVVRFFWIYRVLDSFGFSASFFLIWFSVFLCVLDVICV